MKKTVIILCTILLAGCAGFNFKPFFAGVCVNADECVISVKGAASAPK